MRIPGEGMLVPGGRGRVNLGAKDELVIFAALCVVIVVIVVLVVR